MSSVKRSTLASSELGQLKAPDKWETTSKTIISTPNTTSDTMPDTMSSSTIKTQSQQQSKDVQKSTNSAAQQDTKVNMRNEYILFRRKWFEAECKLRNRRKNINYFIQLRRKSFRILRFRTNDAWILYTHKTHQRMQFADFGIVNLEFRITKKRKARRKKEKEFIIKSQTNTIAMYSICSINHR